MANYSKKPGRGISRRRMLQGATIATAGLVTGLGRAAEPKITDSPPLKIGFTAPYTGPAADTGLEIRRGILMALMDARSEGEIPVKVAGRSRDIEPVWVDTASDPDRAAAATVLAITRDKVALLVGGWHSDVALELMDAESAFRIVHLGHLGEALAIAEKIDNAYGKYRGWFKGWPTPSRMGARYGEPLEYLRNQGLWRPGANGAAVAAEDTAYGRGWGDALRASLMSIGFRVGPPDLFTLDRNNDFRTQLQRYRRDGVALVAVGTTSAQASAAFVRQFHEQQVGALLIGQGLRWNRDWYALTGDSSNYVIAMDSPMPIALWQQWWVRRYQTLFDDAPSLAAAGLHYDYTRMAVRVLNATASLDLDDLIRAIYRNPYRGVWNRYQFSSQKEPQAASPNEVLVGPFMEGFFFPMAQLFNGEARIIWPPRYADQRFIAPPGS